MSLLNPSEFELRNQELERIRKDGLRRELNAHYRKYNAALLALTLGILLFGLGPLMIPFTALERWAHWVPNLIGISIFVLMYLAMHLWAKIVSWGDRRTSDLRFALSINVVHDTPSMVETPVVQPLSPALGPLPVFNQIRNETHVPDQK